MSEAISVGAIQKYRKLRQPYNIISHVAVGLFATTTVYVLFHFRLFGLVFLPITHLFLLILFILPLTFLYIPAHTRLSKEKVPWYDALLAILTFGTIGFWTVSSHLELIIWGAWESFPPLPAVIAGVIIWGLVIEACRRAAGTFFAALVFIVSLYPLVSHLMPGVLRSVPFPFRHVVGAYMAGGEGIVGMPVSIVGNIMIGFILFSCLLMVSGGGKAVLDMALAILGTVRGGAAKVSIVASALMGSISGAIIANILTTGSFTIPAMKRTGYTPHYAAATEACASTGAPITPPIMGVCSFIIAAWLGIPYWQVLVAAIVPCLLYYTALMIQSDGYAALNGLKGLPRSECPRLWPALREFSFFLAALVILVWLIMYMHRLGQAPFYASIFVITCAMLRKKTRLGLRHLKELSGTMARLLLELMPLMCGVGLILTALWQTGATTAFVTGIAHSTGGNVYLMVAFTAIAAFILGMGIGGIAIYFILAVMIGPPLIEFGLDPLACHLFFYYVALLSFITPPVAISSFAAATLAGATPMRTAVQSTRLGIGLFFVPFFFVLNPAFILRGPPLEILLTVGTAFLGMILIASGIEGYLVLRGRLNWVARSICIISGILLFWPGVLPDIIGAATVILTQGLPYIRSRYSQPKAIGGEGGKY